MILLKITFHILQFTFYIVHCTFHNSHFTFHNPHFTFSISSRRRLHRVPCAHAGWSPWLLGLKQLRIVKSAPWKQGWEVSTGPSRMAIQTWLSPNVRACRVSSPSNAGKFRTRVSVTLPPIGQQSKSQRGTLYRSLPVFFRRLPLWERHLFKFILAIVSDNFNY